MISIEIGLSVALIDLAAGFVVGNAFSLSIPNWLSFIGSLAGIVLTFLAGAEVDVQQFRREWRASLSIGVVSFARPFSVVGLLAYYGLGWNHRQAEIAGVAFSTTSLAVVCGRARSLSCDDRPLDEIDPDEPDDERDRDEDQRAGRDIRVEPVVRRLVRVPPGCDRKRHRDEPTRLDGWFLTLPGAYASCMSLAVEIIATLVSVLTAVFVLGLFVWAAKKDGEEDDAVQKRLGIRRRTWLGR
jgi:hypothetical protein